AGRLVLGRRCEVLSASSSSTVTGGRNASRIIQNTQRLSTNTSNAINKDQYVVYTANTNDHTTGNTNKPAITYTRPRVSNDASSACFDNAPIAWAKLCFAVPTFLFSVLICDASSRTILSVSQ